METKCDSQKLKKLGFSMGYKNFAEVDVIGAAGGIWATWDEGIHASMIKVHPRFLLLKVRSG